MSAFALKLIALITMFIDHTGVVLYPELTIFRMIGRISFPLYSFLIAKSCRYTKDRKKFLIRLFIFALISEIPFDLCFNDTGDSVFINIDFFYNTNVLYTMFLAACYIFISDYLEKKEMKIYLKVISMFLTTYLILFLAIALNTDYSYWGIYLIVMFYYLHKHKYLSFIIAFIFIIYFYLGNFIFSYFIFNIIPLFLMLLYNGKAGRLKLKWLFYASYPVHLFILFLIKNY